MITIDDVKRTLNLDEAYKEATRVDRIEIKMGDRVVWNNSANCHGIVTRFFTDHDTLRKKVMIDMVYNDPTIADGESDFRVDLVEDLFNNSNSNIDIDMEYRQRQHDKHLKGSPLPDELFTL